MLKLNIAVIGLGHWGKNYIRLLNEHPYINNIYGCDVLNKNIESIALKYPRAQYFNKYRDIIKTNNIDGVIIATHTSTHYQIGIEFLKNGIHTLIEKPLCMRSEEGEKMIELAKKKQCVLMVGHTFLYNNAVMKMKEIVTTKSFGEIFYITARRTHLGLIRQDVSVHWDLAPHDISIINYLMEKLPQAVQGTAVKLISQNRYDVAFINLYYSNNVLANINVSWLDSNKTREVAVIGKFKKVIFNDLSTEEPLRIYEKGVELVQEQLYGSFGEFKYLIRDGKIESPKIKMIEPLKQQVDDFINSILKNRKPRCDGEIGLGVVKVLEKVDESIKKDGKIVSLS
ncbi:MAG: Gfo/Idh/MocA family protein [Planctomycetota bacterium]